MAVPVPMDAIAEALYNPWDIKEGVTLKDYVPAEILINLREHWWAFPPLKPLYYYIFGIIYLFGGIISVIGNLMVVFVFMKYKTLRTPSNMLIMNLALSDLLIMSTLFPECTINFFMGGIWQFGQTACLAHAFCGALFGYGQIATLVFISFDRYNAIVRGFAAKPLTFCKVFVILFVVWTWALAWSIGPLFFGGYAMEGILASCAFDYLNLEPFNVVYIWSCFIFCYCMPLSVIIASYYSIVKAVFAHERALRDQAKKMNVASLRSNEDAQKLSAEIRIAKVAMINVSLWVIAWTPFAVIVLLGVTGNHAYLTPIVSSLPSLFAKTSCVYNPIIYAISHPKYRQCLQKELPYLCINETEPIKSADNQSSASDGTKCQESNA